MWKYKIKIVGRQNTYLSNKNAFWAMRGFYISYQEENAGLFTSMEIPHRLDWLQSQNLVKTDEIHLIPIPQEEWGEADE